MEFTINIDTIMFILAVLGCVALVFLIILLKRLSSLLGRVDDLINQNTTNIGLAIAKLPSLLSGVDSVVDNAKDISDVAVDFASDALVAKEKVKSGINTSANVAGIVKDVFSK